MTLGEAKEVIHRNLPVDQRAAAERLWDEIIEEAESTDNETD